MISANNKAFAYILIFIIIILVSSYVIKNIYNCKYQAKYVAIEGMPGSGKTTILHKIINENKNNLILVPELHPDYDKKINDYSSVKEFCHQEWNRRKQLFKKYKAKLNSTVIFDRSSFSNLAFLYALDKVNNTNFYNEYYTQYIQDLQDFPYDYILILDTYETDSLQRRLNSREKVNPPWNSMEFLYYIRSFYLNELPKLVRCSLLILNTSKTSQKEVEEIIISKLNKITQKKLFYPRSLSGSIANSEFLGYPVSYYSKSAEIKIDGNYVLLNTDTIELVLKRVLGEIDNYEYK